MKSINLTKGMIALVDDWNYERIAAYSWYAVERKNGVWHAVRHFSTTVIYMHNFITNPSLGSITDHQDHNGLNNQEYNLRVCSYSQNQMNTRKHATEMSSIYKGVCWYGRVSKWVAYINKDGQRYHLGYFINEEDAALAYNKAATELFGEFALFNTISEEYLARAN